MLSVRTRTWNASEQHLLNHTCTVRGISNQVVVPTTV